MPVSCRTNTLHTQMASQKTGIVYPGATLQYRGSWDASVRGAGGQRGGVLLLSEGTGAHKNLHVCSYKWHQRGDPWASCPLRRKSTDRGRRGALGPSVPTAQKSKSVCRWHLPGRTPGPGWDTRDDRAESPMCGACSRTPQNQGGPVKDTNWRPPRSRWQAGHSRGRFPHVRPLPHQPGPARPTSCFPCHPLSLHGESGRGQKSPRPWSASGCRVGPEGGQRPSRCRGGACPWPHRSRAAPGARDQIKVQTHVREP